MPDYTQQTTRPFNAAGNNILPLLKTTFGATKKMTGITTTAGAAVQIHTTDFDRAVRIWAIGCDAVYIFGTAGVAAPSATVDGYVGKDGFVETWMSGADEQYIRVAAGTGTGDVRVELLK